MKALEKIHLNLNKQHDLYKKIREGDERFGYVIEKDYSRYFVSNVTPTTESEEMYVAINLHDEYIEQILSSVGTNLKQYQKKLQDRYKIQYITVEYDENYIFWYIMYMKNPEICYLNTINNAITHNIHDKDKELIKTIKYLQSFDQELDDFFVKIESAFEFIE